MNELNNKKSNISTVIIIVLLAVIAGLCFYIACDKGLIFNDNNNNEQIDNNDNVNNETNDNTANDGEIGNNTNISVTDAVNYIDDYYKEFKVKLPKIVGNSKNIDELNTKILNEVLPRTYSHPACRAQTNESSFTCMDKGSTIDYLYLTKNNVLVLYIYSKVPEGGTAMPASGGGLFKYTYFYDIENEKTLTMTEAAIKLNVDLNKGDCSYIIIENKQLKVVCSV